MEIPCKHRLEAFEKLTGADFRAFFKVSKDKFINAQVACIKNKIIVGCSRLGLKISSILRESESFSLIRIFRNYFEDFFEISHELFSIGK
jgi:hypothetical protein